MYYLNIIQTYLKASSLSLEFYMAEVHTSLQAYTEYYE